MVKLNNALKKYDNVMMKNAILWADESYCERAKVGAVIAIQGRVISTGYNGTISGAENCCEDVNDGGRVKHSIRMYSEKSIKAIQEAWKTNSDNFNVVVKEVLLNSYSKYKEVEIVNVIPCSNGNFVQDFEIVFTHREYTLTSKSTVVHAEANALMFAAKNGIKTDNSTMYITLSPCIECSKMMIQAGVKKVIYRKAYRVSDGIDFLKENGIEVEQLDI